MATSALFIEILYILAPSFILATIGLCWHWFGPEYPIKFVTTLIMNVAGPALMFHTLATSRVDLSSLALMALAAFTVHVVMVGVAFMALRKAKKDWRLCIAHTVGNTGNLGLPVCLFAFGDVGLAYAMTFFSVQCLLLFSLGDSILAGNSNPLKALKSPMLHAIWIGVFVRAMDIQLPDFIFDTSILLGQSMIPIMLITLGVSLASMSTAYLKTALFWSLFRTLLAVCVGFLVASLFGLEGVARGVLVIQTAAPVAVFNYLMAIRHNRDSTEVTGLILVTHIGAIFYLPFILASVL